MRTTIHKQIFLSCLILSATVLCQNSFGQAGTDRKKTVIRILATEDKDGKVKNIEKKYEVPEMSDDDRQAFIDKAVDSLHMDKDSEQSLTITVDDGKGPTTSMKKRGRVSRHRSDDWDATAFNWTDDLAKSFDAEKFRSHFRDFEREFRPKARIVMKDMEDFGDRMGDFWTKEVVKPSTVRDLNVYTNNPDNSVLNLRFQAAQKGDVNILVTDTKGKEVGKKEIKDFSGEFVGQVEIRKNTRGTLFVTVVQNEDGATRRVVLP
jgi:hypothetical protein